MVEPRWLDDDEQGVWRSFLRATQLFMARLDHELQHEAGMPLAYYEILVLLSEAPDRMMRMSVLAEMLQYSRSRVSHALSRLEELGWAKREHCKMDRRGQWASLTDEGFEALVRAAPIHVEGVRAHLFDQFTDTDQADLFRISQVLLNNLTSLD